MKHIVKLPEPAELLGWKTHDKMYLRGRPNYDRIRNEPAAQTALFNSLRAEQGNICCYCERTITVDDCHIEHIAPQNDNRQLSCDYENMLCSCLKNEIKGDPQHCGMTKGSWYVPAEFVSPLDPDCETKFAYTFDGQILPADANDLAAVTTIEKCRLDIDRLKTARGGLIDTFVDNTLSDEELAEYVTNYLVEKEDNGGSYNPFFTTIKIFIRPPHKQ